jgi:tetratricopeptide (TPR) repeat protein
VRALYWSVLSLGMAVRCIAASIEVSADSNANPCVGAETQLESLSTNLNRNQFSVAEDRLKRLKSEHPDCPSILLAEARIKASQGVPEASDLFKRYLEKVPNDPAGLAYFARFLIDQGQYQQAEELSDAAVSRDVNNPAALAVRGQILIMKRQPAQGEALLIKSCELDPDNAESQFQLGALYDRTKRPGEAVKHFQKVVDLDPGYASAWDYLALNLEPLGKVDRADAAYRRGLEVNHEGQQFDAFLDYNYGRFLAKRNQLAESKQHLDRGVELVPDYRDTWYERAKLNLRMGNYAQARSDAERAASLIEQTGGILDLQVYSLLEQIYRRLGEKELADKYANLTRQTPPPTRKGSELTPPQ